MSKKIENQNTAQKRTFRLLAVMALFIFIGTLFYLGLTLVANRRTPVTPNTHATGGNGVSVYYDSAIWPVEQTTEDDTLGTVLELASGTDSADSQYQTVLFQRGDSTTYDDYIEESQRELRESYGVIRPRKVNLKVEGADVTAVRCDLQTYYGVLATIAYPDGTVIYVSGLTKLASVNDIVNLVESVTVE